MLAYWTPPGTPAIRRAPQAMDPPGSGSSQRAVHAYIDFDNGPVFAIPARDG